MRCPTLKELPPPPPGKTGWPWTEENPRLPDAMPDGCPWPKISILTPSYNQGDFIEETIRSVLLQGYPNLEYIIVDGDSTDRSIDIIKQYEKYLACWVSETDNGQTHAVNKGIDIANGSIIGWINSDDVYHKGVFKIIMDTMWEHGEIVHPIVYGGIELIDKKGHVLRIFPGRPLDKKKLIAFWRQEWHIPQPTVFFRSSILKKYKLNESLHYAMDWELYLRLSDKYPFRHIPKTLARFRSHKESKTSQGWSPFTLEQITVSKEYWGERYLSYWWDFHLWPITKKVKEILGLLRRILRTILGHERYEKARSLKAKLFTHHFR